MISLVLALALAAAEPDPCASAPPTCRQAAGEAIIVWKTEALTAERHLAGCEERLAARTSTVIHELVPVPLTRTATVVEPAGPWSLWTVTGGAVGVVLGVLLMGLVAR